MAASVIFLTCAALALGLVIFFVRFTAPPPPPEPPGPRFAQPFLVQGVYLPADSAGRPAKVRETIELLERTSLNAVVIDIKDSTGKISYQSSVPIARAVQSNSDFIPNIRGVLEQFHEAGIYVIGRIVVFQDPVLAEAHPEWAVHSRKRGGALWRDNRGVAWIDPSARPAWIYNAEIAEEAVSLGFDEINFDYIRFPSDGPLADMIFPVWDQKAFPKKYQVILQFFEYLDERLRTRAAPPIPISADIFGMTFWRGGEDDLNIGQRLEDAMLHFDFIQPMLYPSHFPPTFEGFKNPADHPYEIVSRSLAQKRSLFDGAAARVRPWLQDFDLGADYTPELIQAQIKAAYEQEAFGWTFWNPAGTYTKEAFDAETLLER